MYRSHVLVCGGTGCTSSGSQRIRERLEKEIAANGLSEEVGVVKTGCIGLCQYEPIVEVMEPGKEKVTYVKMTPEKTLEVLRLHLIGGQIVTKYTLGAAQNSL